MSEEIALNDDRESPFDRDALVNAAAASGPFPIAAGSRDAALVEFLQTGGYTVHVLTDTGAPGVALVELYQVE